MRLSLVFTALLSLVLLFSIMVLLPSLVAAADPAPFHNCRLGILVDWEPAGDPNLQELNLGWFGNFTVNTSTIPDGMEFMRNIRLNQKHGNPYTCRYGVYGCYSSPPTYTLNIPGSLYELAQMVADHPGSMWAVGNEPDGRQWWDGQVWSGQDDTTPQVYARAYCEISQVIRETDPTARIAIGAIIQGTPLRMEYLNRIWDAYPDVCNGRRLGDDVDIWNMHNYVLREASVMCYDRSEAWGAEIPPGLYPEYCKGQWTSPEDNGRVDLAIQQIVRMRQWMADHGERDKPLIITEAGLNLGSYWVSPSQVEAFMTTYLEYVLNHKDPVLGSPLDDYRLVQRILWWSLNHDASIDSQQQPGHSCYPNCTLHVDSLLGTVTNQAYREQWVSYVTDPAHPEASVPRVGLFVAQAEASARGGDPMTYTLRAHIHNNGNTLAPEGTIVQFYEAVEDQPGQPIGGPHVLPEVCGCGEGVVVEQTWVDESSNTAPTWCVSLDEEPPICFSTQNVYLPLILKKR